MMMSRSTTARAKAAISEPTLEQAEAPQRSGGVAADGFEVQGWETEIAIAIATVGKDILGSCDDGGRGVSVLRSGYGCGCGYGCDYDR